MISNLKIENIAIIEYASIDFTANFNCLTGETGAGKSIIIDSINAVLGEKTSRELIRTGESKATVTAYFTEISKKTTDILYDLGVPCEEDNSLLISRVIYKDGKNQCRVNGSSVTVSMLKKIGFSLINIHGQSDNQELMSPELHYTFIDAVADNNQLLDEYQTLYNKLLDIKSQINKLTVDDSLKARKIDLLTYQIDELQKANLQVGEKYELTAKKTLINNSQKFTDALNTAYSAISGNDETPGAASCLFSAANALSSVADYMPEIKTLADAVSDMAYNAEEYSSQINSMMSETNFDDYQLSDIEERLDLIYRLSKKYGENEEEMLLYLDKATEELHNITYSDELIEKLNAEYDSLKRNTYEAAQKLSDSRKKSAAMFSEKIQNELSFLDMPDTKFSVDIKECAFCETGIDNIEFLISANRGEEPKPLAKIASGGELSRIMLAIKSVLADKDGTDTLIFDEIDAGVSGRAAGKIALKLNDVSRNKQVICITHLPSIAAFADNHMLIQKSVHGDKTYTSVTSLDTVGRMAEIARIIGGNENDKIHLESAKRLLDDAVQYKERT